jgi:ubiquinone/menaquinone biosynthesis C-methylase UbiE
MTEAAPAYWNRVARRYAERPVSDLEAYEAALARVRAHLAPGDRMLELGCGTGTTALTLADAVSTITACDFSEEMVAIARERAAAADVANVAFHKADALAAPPEDAPFDAILAFNLLHLLDDLDAALARVRALLRPGGAFISKTVCLRDLGPHLRLAVWGLRRAGVLPPVMRGFRAPELEARIAAAGFAIVETGTFPRRPPGRLVIARRV